MLEGIGQGILISLLSFGPSFFSLIHAGIKGGKKQGLIMALGIFMSEFTVAMLYFFGLAAVFSLPAFQKAFSLVASIAIITMGIKSIIKPYHHFVRSMSNAKANNSQSLIKGFIVNLTNPFVLVLWGTLLATVSLRYDAALPHSKTQIFINLVAILITLFSMDMCKVLLSHFLGKKLSNRVYYLVNRYFAVILILIGLYFLYHFFALLNK